MDKLKLVRARGAAMHSLGILIHHDRESLQQILTFVKDHLLEEEAQATKALFLANEAIRKVQYGKA
jgi:hypothetical protein